MSYTWYELVVFLMVYSVLGWIGEMLWTSVRTGHFCNRGVLNGPWCVTYGLAMNVITIAIDTLQGRYILQAVFCVITASLACYISGALTEKMTSLKLWDYELKYIFQGTKKGVLFSVVIGLTAMTVALVFQPALYFAVTMIPDMILVIVSIVFTAFLVFDMITVYMAVKTHEKVDYTDFSKDLGERKEYLGSKLYALLRNRINKAYPGIMDARVQEGERQVFAGGICFDKFFWIFVIWAFLGDVIETIFVGLQTGRWMSRSSLIYGTFSIVWGLGAALATVFLHRLIGREDRYIFIGGFFLGGAYEYLCSVFTEVFFGTTFWDYSNMPFNIGGRTNLLFCMFWGIIAIVWLKFLYPACSRLIEKVPVVAGKVMTWIVLVLFLCDAVISVAAMTRYVERREGVQASNKIEHFVDYHYPDAVVEFVWPNMRVK